jgi:membrane protease subunit HflK
VKVYEEYKKAPEVTRQRIYYETLEKVFSGTDKIIIDSGAASGAIPYLPLPELARPAQRPAPTTQPGGAR